MKTASRRALCISAIGFFGLSACEAGNLFAPTTSDEPTAAAPQTTGEARVEIQELQRPDIFSTTERGLWDGRPSLGGVWVAHPDVVDPERVRIENTENGQVIEGALFKRERESPGPRIQISSEAAAALGILAGQPTELSLVVLRQEEVIIEPLPVAEDPVETSEGEVNDTSGDDLAIAGATAAAVEAKPQRKGFWASIRDSFRGNTGPAIESEEITAGAETVDDATAPSVETATLDPVTAAAAAAIDEAETSASAAQAAPARPASVSNGSTLKNPFVQVGLFSVQANADAAAASLRQAGIVPSIVEGSRGSTPFWRVLVGPVTTSADQSAMLARVRDLGYKDAFLTPK